MVRHRKLKPVGAGRKRKYTDQQIIDAIRKAQGLVYHAAKHLGCDPQTIANRKKQCKAIREAIREFRGRLIDDAESQLQKAIKKGQGWAVQFALKTLGKNRGYVERTETRIGGDDNAPPIQTETIDVDALPLDLRMALLAHIQAKKAEKPLELPPPATKQGDVTDAEIVTPG